MWLTIWTLLTIHKCGYRKLPPKSWLFINIIMRGKYDYYTLYTCVWTSKNKRYPQNPFVMDIIK